MFNIYTPRFFDSNYTKEIKQNLYSSYRIENDSNRYRFLCQLNSHAFKFQKSTVELQKILRSHFISAELLNNLNELEYAVNQAINLTLHDKPLPINLKHTIENRTFCLNNDLKSNNFYLKLMSTANLLINSTTILLAVAGIFIGASMCVSGPFLPALIGFTYMIVSASVAACALYTTVVEGRFLANRQIQEINDMGSLFVHDSEHAVMNEMNRGDPMPLY